MLRKQIVLENQDDIHGRCLYVKLHGEHVDANGESVYVGAYTHSDNLEEH